MFLTSNIIHSLINSCSEHPYILFFPAAISDDIILYYCDVGNDKIAWILTAFVANAPFLYPLKTSENCKVFWCFHEVEKGDIGNKRVNSFIDFIHIVRQPIGLFLQGLSLHIWEVKIFSLFLTSVEVLSCLFMFAGMTFVPKIIEKIFSRWFLWQIFPCYLIE